MKRHRFALTGTDNDGFRHRYSVKKNDSFKEAFAKFMDDLGFDGKEISNGFVITSTIDTPEGEEEITRVIEVSELIDACYNYQNKEFDVDVFYGKEKVIILVRTKKRIPVVKHLENKSKWISKIEAKRIREKNLLKNKNIFLRKIKK